MQISINRALSELKLLNNRIEKTAKDSAFICSNKKSAKKINNMYTKEEFISGVLANYKSTIDLIERRKVIKSAIVESNANTIVKIADKEMTVASAIERKDSIKYDKILLQSMTKQLNDHMVNVERNNQSVQSKLDELLLVSFGKEGKQKATEDEITNISRPYLDQNEWELIDPLKLKEKIDSLGKSIEEFEANVDFVLSESNTLTKIEVSEN